MTQVDVQAEKPVIRAIGSSAAVITSLTLRKVTLFPVSSAAPVPRIFEKLWVEVSTVRGSTVGMHKKNRRGGMVGLPDL